MRKGNRHYNKKEYVKALENYSRAGVKSPENPKIKFNAGTALYRLEEFQKSAGAFADSTSTGTSRTRRKKHIVPPADKKFMRDAIYNRGNALFKEEEYKQAAQSYMRALLIDPEDSKAKHNLQMALERIKLECECKEKNKKKDSGKKKQDKQDGGKPQRPEMSKEDAERILQMMKEKEKSTVQPDMLNSRAQKKLIHQEQPEKDW